MTSTMEESVRRRVAALEGFVFDLDGTIWEGPRLLPGAAELTEALRRAGRGVVYASNCSRYGAGLLHERLVNLGIEADPGDVVSAFDLVGEEICRRLGTVPVFAVGTGELAEVLRAAGCEPLDEVRASEAKAVVVGVDPDFSYGRLRAAARVVAAGAAFFAINLDARFPVGPDLFDPGCGALAEAIAVASGKRPITFGKPEHPLFRAAIARLGRPAELVAMVGDSTSSDMQGGRSAGMFTIWVDQSRSATRPSSVDLVVADPRELLKIWNDAQNHQA